ncbi:MAG: hypothetical protein ACNA7V_09315 [Bacteroidales bacterium]
MGLEKNISKDPMLDERIKQFIRQKKDENVALKKLLSALEKARQTDFNHSNKN